MPSLSEKELLERILELEHGYRNPYKLTKKNWALFKSIVYAKDSPSDDAWMNKVLEELLEYPDNFEYFYKRRKMELFAVGFFKENNLDYNPDYPAKDICAHFILDGREYSFYVDIWRPIYSIWTIVKNESWNQVEFEHRIEHICKHSCPPLRKGIDEQDNKQTNPVFILDQLCITPEEFRLQFPYALNTVKDAADELYHYFSPRFR